MKPLDAQCRELDRQFCQSIGYDRGNMFLCDWQEDNLGNLNLYDVFDCFYPMKFGSMAPYEAAAEGARYEIQKDIFEQAIADYLKVSEEVFRERCDWDEETGGFEYISNRILPSESNVDFSWHDERLTNQQREQIYEGGTNLMNFVIEHLSKSFEKKEVLKDIDFTFESGKIYGLLGRNGAGKTTLFNCLNQDLKADGGMFYLEEDTGRREVKAEDIGYVLSTPTVPEFLTGREFLKFFIDINRDSIENLKTLDEYFNLMTIAPEDRDKLLKDYSHGMKNKMQMLINIIAQPNVLLLDEPLTSLDVVVAEEMKQLLRSLKEGRVTIFSTHIMDLALDLCDEIVLLNHGELEVVEKSNLDSHEFRDKIIAILREDANE